ncbi:hypothetical protein CRG98_033829 [Punica granatum]|uniref:Uncharacterized protein n=1 Tax=Punica granatum TaxID=22663 RepID=A0A2I0IPA4_PUNGR|nr:hypothetical protein CRG98_033829 [Punica granatum]
MRRERVTTKPERSGEVKRRQQPLPLKRLAQLAVASDKGASSSHSILPIHQHHEYREKESIGPQPVISQTDHMPIDGLSDINQAEAHLEPVIIESTISTHEHNHYSLTQDNVLDLENIEFGPAAPMDMETTKEKPKLGDPGLNHDVDFFLHLGR